MRRPSYQHYPGDWRNNTKLRRCSWAARGVWVEALGLMHDSDEYGILRWPLKDVAQAIGAPIALVRELATNLVIKGSDDNFIGPQVYTPYHGGRRGPSVILVPAQPGPIWFSSRMVRDEYVRVTRGFGRRLGDAPNGAPMPPIGTSFVPPSSSSSSSSIKAKERNTLSDSPSAASDVIALPDQSGKPSRLTSDASTLLDFLNAKAGRHYRPTKKTLEPVVARLKEGYSLGECRAVIARKVREWGNNEKMCHYLRPVTLFGAEKFAQYVGEVPPPEAEHAAP